jgi:hypothetical protein
MLQFIAVYQWWLLTTGWLQRFNSPLTKQVIESYLEIAMANSKIVKVLLIYIYIWRLVWKTFKSPKKTRFKLRFLCAAQRGNYVQPVRRRPERTSCARGQWLAATAPPRENIQNPWFYIWYTSPPHMEPFIIFIYGRIFRDVLAQKKLMNMMSGSDIIYEYGIRSP